MAGHHNKFLFAGASRKLIDLRHLCRQGFFHEQVFTGLEDLLGEGEVTRDGCCDHYAVDPGIFESNLMVLDWPAERKIRFHKGAAFRARIRDILDRASRQGGKVSQ